MVTRAAPVQPLPSVRMQVSVPVGAFPASASPRFALHRPRTRGALTTDAGCAPHYATSPGRPREGGRRPGASGAAKPSGPSRAGAVVIDDGKARARGMTSKLDGPAKPAHSRVIRGSARGDGTRRKDVLLRAGFRSEELDVGTYKPAKAIEYRKALRAAASERRKQGQKTPPVDALKNLKL